MFKIHHIELLEISNFKLISRVIAVTIVQAGQRGFWQ